MQKAAFPLVLCFLLIMLLAASFAFTKNPDQATNGLGNVTYSILPPDRFKVENGDGWILLDHLATDKLPSSKLSSEHGIQELPDARGVFIRGVNGKRDSTTGDTDPGRLAGSYQQDMLGAHDHDVLRYNDKYPRSGGSTHDMWRNDQTVKTGMTGGPETRPRNIALYVYIKIN